MTAARPKRASALERGLALERESALEAARKDYGLALRRERRGAARARILYRRFVVRAKLGDHLGALGDLRRAHALDRRCTWLGRGPDEDGLPPWTLDHAISRHPRCGWLYAWRALARQEAGMKEASAEDGARAWSLGARPSWVRDRGGIAERAAAVRMGTREALDQLRGMFMLQDFLAVLHGLRRAAFYYDVPQRTLEALRLLCGAHRLSLGSYRDPSSGDTRTVWTKDPRLLETCLRDGALGGRALPSVSGYPACCRRFDERLTADYPDLRTRPPYPVLTLRGTRSRRPPSSLMNGLYHLESRDWGKRGLKGLRSDYSQYHLLPWNPCSFDCRPSLRYARRMLGLLRETLPGFAQDLLRLLRRPVLLFSDFEFASLEGRPRRGGVEYSSWLDPTGLLPEEARRGLDQGDSLSVAGGEVAFSKSGRIVARYRRDCELFIFSSNEG